MVNDKDPHQITTKFDWWLSGICLARTFNGLVFLTYAAALPVLQYEWRMSAATAGSIAGGFQFGYAVSLITFSFLAAALTIGGHEGVQAAGKGAYLTAGFH